MSFTLGIDVGSTYTKAVLLDADGAVAASAMVPTGFRFDAAAEQAMHQALHRAGAVRREVAYVVATGHGRYQVPFRDTHATDLTAQGRGVHHLLQGVRTVLDVGGQTMKASRLDERGRVTAFRLNDKCAAGTGAFLEKSARYLGYGIEQIGPLAESSREPATISGVCAVFAESEVINHVSAGVTPGDILHGSMVSLVQRSVQLLKRVRIEPDIALVGGIMRFPTMVRVLREQLGSDVFVPAEPMAQFTAALGAAVLARRRLERRAA